MRLAIAVLMAGGLLAGADKAVVLEVGEKWVSTGRSESGTVRSNGGGATYSGDSAETGYSVVEYVLRVGEKVLVVRWDPAQTWGPFRNPVSGRKRLGVRAGDVVGLQEGKKGMEMVVDGKGHRVRVMRETMAAVR